ncbi:hypothetical protein J8273_3132 [Carpediemonas membranifera]|uniref:Uncharacterized protein n=1 Tax=Carpediemonas membranifera TaxID=201153 RepID=A0A8J6AYI9_9EUKA|nr:hypothetical protein J8273_3132 [Carpediemonas membranifera]|eukprot:KAG9395555.1 hypothetical protein J8273_3132 [Carpediemonas membranifera]
MPPKTNSLSALAYLTLNMMYKPRYYVVMNYILNRIMAGSQTVTTTELCNTLGLSEKQIQHITGKLQADGLIIEHATPANAAEKAATGPCYTVDFKFLINAITYRLEMISQGVNKDFGKEAKAADILYTCPNPRCNVNEPFDPHRSADCIAERDDLKYELEYKLEGGGAVGRRRPKGGWWIRTGPGFTGTERGLTIIYDPNSGSLRHLPVDPSISIIVEKSGRVKFRARTLDALGPLRRSLATEFTGIDKVKINGRFPFSIKLETTDVGRTVVDGTVQTFVCPVCGSAAAPVSKADMAQTQASIDRNKLPKEYLATLKACQDPDVIDGLIARVVVETTRATADAHQAARRTRRSGHDAKMAALQLIRANRVDMDLPPWFDDVHESVAVGFGEETHFPAIHAEPVENESAAAVTEADLNLLPDIIGEDVDVDMVGPREGEVRLGDTTVDLSRLTMAIEDLVDLLETRG